MFCLVDSGCGWVNKRKLLLLNLGQSCDTAARDHSGNCWRLWYGLWMLGPPGGSWYSIRLSIQLDLDVTSCACSPPNLESWKNAVAAFVEHMALEKALQSSLLCRRVFNTISCVAANPHELTQVAEILFFSRSPRLSKHSKNCEMSFTTKFTIALYPYS